MIRLEPRLQWLDNVDMHSYANFDVFQELCAFSQNDHGRTDSHSDYSADPRVVQFNIRK